MASQSGVILLLLLVACGPKPVTPVGVWQMQLIAPVPRDALTKVECELHDIPVAPEVLHIDYEDGDIMSRAMVPVRAYNIHVEFSRDMAKWANLMNACMKKIIKENPNLIRLRPVTFGPPVTRRKPPSP